MLGGGVTANRTADGACFIQCVFVLVYKCLFNHRLSSSWGGGGTKTVEGRGRGFFTNPEGERIEYFVIVQSEGDSMYISILYICDENALAFCVTLPLPVSGSTFSVSVLIIYIWFVLFDLFLLLLFC